MKDDPKKAIEDAIKTAVRVAAFSGRRDVANLLALVGTAHHVGRADALTDAAMIFVEGEKERKNADAQG